MKSGEQRDNLSGFEVMYLAQEDDSLETKHTAHGDNWQRFDAKKIFTFCFLAEKYWSIRKPQSNLDTVMNEIIKTAEIDTYQYNAIKCFIAEYIKD